MWCKHTNYEIDTRIPLVIRLPGQAHAGSVVTEPTETIDIFPTLCEYLGLDVPESVEGQSFAYLFEDPQESTQTVAYSEYQRHAGITGFSMQHDNTRYTEWIHLESGEIRSRELYDHSVDPDENRNVADLPDYRERINVLSELLHEGPAGRYVKEIKSDEKPEDEPI
jgi:iduronate 2-sulfatase